MPLVGGRAAARLTCRGRVSPTADGPASGSVLGLAETAAPARRARALGRQSRSAGARSRSARTSAFASDFFLCGPITMIMLRPSCFGADSTKPSSSTSPARRCSSRNPSSGRCCSRPRNMIVILTLSPCLQEPHDVTLLGLVVVGVDLRAKLHLFDDRVGLVAPCLTCLLGVFVLELAVVHELADRRASRRGNLDEVEIGLLGQPQARRRCGRCRPARRWGRPGAPRVRGYGR